MAVSSSAEPRYRALPPDRSVSEVEEELLARWREEDLFTRSLRAREGGDTFVFFEGPPTANGRPGMHHVFSRTLKDLFCRHRAMQGYDVSRKAGWDTHGLPVELEVEKSLGISGKPQIEEVGVEKFNALCRESAFTYRTEFEKLSQRIGYWLDYEHPYVTYTNDYIESVWWALATLHRKGLLYRGHKILPYCPRCGTALSSHELALGYEDVDDPSVTIALELEEAGISSEISGVLLHERKAHERQRVLVWTTTPWTLVSNVALAVHPELEYAELRSKKKPEEGTILLAEARVAAVLGGDWADRWERVGSHTGASLVGRRYRRPLDWMPYPPDGEHEVIVGEAFVSAEDGTGVVHMAPAFGADDYAAAKRNNLAFLQPVNARGEFPADMPLIGGKFVKGANGADPLIIEELKRRGVLWKATTMTHSYPHCWRCRTPLLYYARTSWFVRTTAYRDEMLARNAAVDWHPPETGSGRFGEWLEHNIDWAISRDRYWGTPLPAWVCERDPDHVQFLGSFEELSAKTGASLPSDFDAHKPFIDRYSWPCETCAKTGVSATMRRTNEVIDTWFDSGSMPFAQWHYPFENREIVESQYPADFICEGVDQTRGWFYSLLAIAAGLGDALPHNASGRDQAAPYRACIVNDLLLDAEGQKMSKSRGNVVDPWAVMARHGADATRLFLISSSQIWVPRRFDENALREGAGRFLITLKNLYSGVFAQYANFGWEPSDDDPPVAKRPLLDRWVLARLRETERRVDALLTEYDATAAARELTTFVDDDVSKWYVRLTRDRYYDVDTADSRAAFATLHEVLTVSCRLLAPFAPFVSDWMHRELTGESVHLASYVRDDAGAADDQALMAAMRDVRQLATLGRAAREEAGIKVRQPLSRLLCVVPSRDTTAIEPLLPLLAAELNVKSVEMLSSADALVSLSAKANFRMLGKRFGGATPKAAAAIAALDSETLRRFEHGEAIQIEVDGVRHALEAGDLTLERRASGDVVVEESGGYVAAIDPTVTPALRREGIARELVSRIQRLRKESGLAVSDRIRLVIAGAEEVEAAAAEHRDRIGHEVLAVAVEVGGAAGDEHHATQSFELDGLGARVAITREA